MPEIFSYDVEAESDGEVKQQVWENDFGDGYTQAGGVGINAKSQSWSLSHTGLLLEGEEALEIQRFLDRHEGYRTCYWTPPGGVQGRYRANGYKIRSRGAPNLVTITWTFDQRFTPY